MKIHKGIYDEIHTVFFIFYSKEKRIVMKKIKEMNKFSANVKITPVNALTFLN